MSGDVLCAFAVTGRPRTKGNLRTSPATGRAYEATKGLPAWVRLVSRAAGASWSGGPFRGAVRVDVAFTVPARRRDVLRAGLRDGVEPVTRSSGDLDKLARACLDALTGICRVDDAQVVDLRASKRYDLTGGAHVIVRRADVP